MQNGKGQEPCGQMGKRKAIAMAKTVSDVPIITSIVVVATPFFSFQH
jgi:hypothetical protein